VHVPGAQELLIIALVALFVLGPERLPEVARAAAKLLTRIRNYGVTASKELRGVADLSSIEREITDLRNELDRTRADLRRAMRETVASSSGAAVSGTSRPGPTPAGTSVGTPVDGTASAEHAEVTGPDGTTGPERVDGGADTATDAADGRA
jgi:sec-independent protein translocase protein TatB